jgi:hypothetical protein
MSLGMTACGETVDNHHDETKSFIGEYQVDSFGGVVQEQKSVDKQKDSLFEESDTQSSQPLYLNTQAANEDLIELDESKVRKEILQNIVHHIDSLETTLSFIESSSTIETIINMMPSEDEEEETNSEIEMDLSDVRDFLVDFLEDHVLVKANSHLRTDGKELIYEITPEYYCINTEVDIEENKEDSHERLREERECTKRLLQTPIKVSIKAEKEGNLNLSLLIGQNNIEAAQFYVHTDRLGLYTELSNLRTLLETIISPDEFEIPSMIDGSFYAQIEEKSALKYSAMFSVPEAINILSDNEGIFVVQVPEMETPGSIVFDGFNHSIKGILDVGKIHLTLPWQHILDEFYDDEGQSEYVCTLNEDTKTEDCSEQWVDPIHPPETKKSFIVDVPGIIGKLNYTLEDDSLLCKGIGVGSSPTTVHVDDHQIIQFDLNPEDKRNISFALNAPYEKQLQMKFDSLLDARLDFTWHHVAEDIADLPSFLNNDRLGVLFTGTMNPTLLVNNENEEFDFSVEEGVLTMWSTNMEHDVLVEEGHCIIALEDADRQEESQSIFGELVAGDCME